MTDYACRFCKAPLTETLVDLGETPLANSYLPDDPAAVAAEKSWPLHCRICTTCWLAQLDTDAPAEEIFSHDYAYLSSYSDSWVAHARRYATEMTARFGIGPDSMVVEIASNDGYLLQHFAGDGTPVQGIEPAGHAAKIARDKGVPTEVLFFNGETAANLAAKGLSADLIAANNVLAHVPDIAGFVAGFPKILKPQGVVTFEFPHLLNLITLGQFDTIYHEHYSYLSLLAVERILASAGLRVFDVQELPTHGGSLRVFACHDNAAQQPCAGLATVRSREAAAGLGAIGAYRDFTRSCEATRAGFIAFLKEAQTAGKSVAGYGAAAKGNTFLNYCSAGPDTLTCVADRNPEKQGTLLPGSHIRVVSPEALSAFRPDFVLILPWNLSAEISETMSEIREWGGRFVTAIPEIRIF